MRALGISPDVLPAGKSTAGRWAPRWAVVTLSLVALGIFFIRWVGRDSPGGPDPCTYAIIGHQMLAGKTLYADLWDHKPPLIHICYMLSELVVGFGQQQFLLLGVSLAVATMIAVYVAAVELTGGMALAGIFAAVLWALISADPRVDGSAPNAEAFMNFCLTAGFAVMTRRKGWGVGQACVAGVLFAAGSLFKHTVAPAAAVLALVHIILPPEGVGRRAAVKHAVIIGLIGVVAWSVVVLYFVAVGRFRPFFQAVFLFNISYSYDPHFSVIRKLRYIFQGRPAGTGIFMYGAPVATLLFVLTHLRSFARQSWLLIAFYVISLVQIALPAHYYRHYYQLVLPPFAIGAGVCAATLLKNQNVKLGRGVRQITFAVLLIVIAPYELRAPAEVASGRVDFDLYYTDRQLAFALNRALAPGQKFYLWGWPTNMYFYSGRLPDFDVYVAPHPVSALPQRYEQPWAAADRKYISDHIIQSRPEIFVLASDPYCVNGLVSAPAVNRFVMAEYSPAKPYGPNYILVVRKDAKLAMPLDDALKDYVAEDDNRWFHNRAQDGE